MRVLNATARVIEMAKVRAGFFHDAIGELLVVFGITNMLTNNGDFVMI